MDVDGSEAYSRQAKTILQVATYTDPQPQVTRPVGLLLEIVLDVDPYTQRLEWIKQRRPMRTLASSPSLRS